jgi:hypothetical protein
MGKCPKCAFDNQSGSQLCSVCQTRLGFQSWNPLGPVVGWLRRPLGRRQLKISTSQFGELTAHLRGSQPPIRWDGCITRPGGSDSLEISMWGDRGGPHAQNVAFLERLLSELTHREEMAREALSQSPDRGKWPEAVSQSAFALSGIEAEDEEREAFCLKFKSAEDPEGEYDAFFEKGLVEETYRHQPSKPELSPWLQLLLDTVFDWIGIESRAGKRY